jgi:hypothetical protein
MVITPVPRGDVLLFFSLSLRVSVALKLLLVWISKETSAMWDLGFGI